MRPSLTLLLVLATRLPAAVIFEDGFETLDATRWTADARGGAAIAIADQGLHGKCLRITSEGQYAYLTVKLDAAKYRGSSLTMSGMVKLDNGRMGEQVYATPKFHFMQRVEGSNQAQHVADRWTGTFDWTPKRLSIDVDPRCTELVMDIGNQNGFGTFYVDDFKLEDTLGKGRPVSLLSVFNTGRSDGVAGDGAGSFLDTGPLDLFNLPDGPLETPDATFMVPKPGDNQGQVLLALRGAKCPQFPLEAGPVAVGQRLTKLALLHAAAWADVAARQPVYTLRVRYPDGQTAEMPMRAGVEIGNFDAPQPCENWQLGWQGSCGAGKPVGLGATVWVNPRPEVAVESVSFVSAGHGVALVAAVSYVPAR
ncbi:MAG: hypothetical protein HYU66_23640 [Armatimonadetes bacterium]|nr:hypothetical protein [Armatimonadota bacterium]